MEVYQSWTDLKSTFQDKGLQLQYTEDSQDYTIWAIEGEVRYWTDIPKEGEQGGSDEEDFVDNYKADANQPLFIGEDKVIDALEIRDTNDHTSSVSDNRGAIPKTIIICNDLEQEVTIQLEGDRQSSMNTKMDVGESFVVAAGAKAYSTISDYLPYMRLKVTASGTPTTGDLNAWILRVKQ